jgi:multiple sugar transport system ATP-binding protein
MRAEIILLRQKLNTTFIYVTHDQTEAMTLADRIVIMKDGYIMQVGTPEECFDMPQNLFVAEFIGAPKMNIIRTELGKDGSGYYVKPFGVKIPVDGSKGEALKARGAATGEILLGVRPEHIQMAHAGDPGAIPVTLEVNEMMGSELHLHVFTEDGTRVIVRIPTIDLEPGEREKLVAGYKMYITFQGKVMHFFNAETEKNLLTE